MAKLFSKDNKVQILPSDLKGNKTAKRSDVRVKKDPNTSAAIVVDNRDTTPLGSQGMVALSAEETFFNNFKLSDMYTDSDTAQLFVNYTNNQEYSSSTNTNGLVRNISASALNSERASQLQSHYDYARLYMTWGTYLSDPVAMNNLGLTYYYRPSKEKLQPPKWRELYDTDTTYGDNPSGQTDGRNNILKYHNLELDSDDSRYNHFEVADAAVIFRARGSTKFSNNDNNTITLTETGRAFNAGVGTNPLIKTNVDPKGHGTVGNQKVDLFFDCRINYADFDSDLNDEEFHITMTLGWMGDTHKRILRRINENRAILDIEQGRIPEECGELTVKLGDKILSRVPMETPSGTFDSESTGSNRWSGEFKVENLTLDFLNNCHDIDSEKETEYVNDINALETATRKPTQFGYQLEMKPIDYFPILLDRVFLSDGSLQTYRFPQYFAGELISYKLNLLDYSQKKTVGVEAGARRYLTTYDTPRDWADVL